MPLQRVEVANLLVEQAFLEGPQVPLALLGIHGARLLDVQVVEHRILVAAVVVVGDAHRLEFLDVEVGLDDEPTLGVAGHLEVAAPEMRDVGRGLDRLHPHVQADLLPLVDEPDRDRLVRLWGSAILVREGEAVPHACPATFGHSAATCASRSARLKPRNWTWARSPRMAAT